MSTEIQLPFYAKTTVILFGVSLIIAILYLGSSIFIPFTYSVFIAIVLDPINQYFIRRRFPKPVSITLCILFAALLLVGIFLFLYEQMAQFSDRIPELAGRIDKLLDQVRTYFSKEFGISYRKQTQIFNEISTGGMEGGFAVALGTVFAALNIAFLAILTPIYVFLLLYYKELFVRFFFRVFPRQEESKVREILGKIRGVLSNYLTGIGIETGIVAILNITGLFVLGIESAFLFGTIAAILNLIPFVGIIIGSIPPIALAILTKDSIWYPLGVIIVFSVIQFIDNNILVPRIVGGKVSVNDVVSIIALIAGGLIWGLSGIILSLPLVAMLKAAFDSIDELKPWGMLLGDAIPGGGRLKDRMRKKNS